MTDKIINLYVKPGSSVNSIDGKYKDSIKVRIRAQPIRGKANKSLIKYLSNVLDIPKNNIHIISGKKSNYKKILVKWNKNIDILSKLL